MTQSPIRTLAGKITGALIAKKMLRKDDIHTEVLLLIQRVLKEELPPNTWGRKPPGGGE